MNTEPTAVATGRWPDQIFLRFLMVLGGMAPLFGLWAVRGTCLMNRWGFLSICLAIVIVPNAVLWIRVKAARNRRFGSFVDIGSFEDRREGVLVYLVAILLPFYSASLDSWSDMTSALLAVAFILSVFMYLDLHYVNILFAMGGYKIFFFHPLEPEDGLSSRQGAILITKKPGLRIGDKLSVQRLTDRIYVERK